MSIQVSAVRITTSLQERSDRGVPTEATAPESMTSLAVRVYGEYREMPGLRLTPSQAARLFSVDLDVAGAVLEELQRASILARSHDGYYSLAGGPSRAAVPPANNVHGNGNGAHAMGMQIDRGAMVGTLRDASSSRLACLLRHWTWADEARAGFDRELANGWDYDDDPMSDHPFGAYYHWCALLCALGEAALQSGLLSPAQLAPLREDIEASLPALRASRHLLIVIPASLEEHPRVVDLLRDDEALARLRRVHRAFGDALREELAAREIDSLDH